MCVFPYTIRCVSYIHIAYIAKRNEKTQEKKSGKGRASRAIFADMSATFLSSSPKNLF